MILIFTPFSIFTHTCIKICTVCCTTCVNITIHISYSQYSVLPPSYLNVTHINNERPLSPPHWSTPSTTQPQIRTRSSGRRVLRRGRRECRAPSPQPRGGPREHGRVSRVEACHDGRPGHAAPRTDDRRGRGRGAHADRALVAVLGSVLPRRLGGVLRTVIFRVCCTRVSLVGRG